MARRPPDHDPDWIFKPTMKADASNHEINDEPVSEYLVADMRAPRVLHAPQPSAYCLDTWGVWGDDGTAVGGQDWSEKSPDVNSEYQASEASPLQVLPRPVSFFCLRDLREYDLNRREWDRDQGIKGSSDDRPRCNLELLARVTKQKLNQ